MLLFPRVNTRNRAGTCNIKVFNNDVMQITNCANKPFYKELVTSTVDPKMSSKMRYSQYLRSYGCIPELYAKYA